MLLFLLLGFSDDLDLFVASDSPAAPFIYTAPAPVSAHHALIAAPALLAPALFAA